MRSMASGMHSVHISHMINIYFYEIYNVEILAKCSYCTMKLWQGKHELPPDDVPMAAPSDEATLVTAEGLYVHEVPQTSTFKSLSW